MGNSNSKAGGSNVDVDMSKKGNPDADFSKEGDSEVGKLKDVSSEADAAKDGDAKVDPSEKGDIDVDSPAEGEANVEAEPAEPTSYDGDTNGDAVIPGTMLPDDESDKYQPRLSNLCKWPDFDGYGFNLHAEKDKPGQYIGSVDPDSPAETGGLREGDRIIEVNGENIESYTHAVVISKIKSRGDETQMLVVDKATDEYYKNRGQTVSRSMSNVVVFTTPRRKSDEEGTKHVTAVTSHVSDVRADYDDDDDYDEDRFNPDTLPEPNVSLSDEEPEKVEAEVTQTVKSAPVPEENQNGTSNGIHRDTEDRTPVPEPEPVREEPEPEPAVIRSTTSAAVGDLNLNLSAAEMKERLRNRRKQDPRMQKQSFEQKNKMFEKL